MTANYKKFLPLLMSLLLAAVFTSCKSDNLPESFTLRCDLYWNGPELANGDMLEIESVEIGTLTLTDEDGLVTTVDNPVVDRVEYFIGNRLIGQSSTPPYRRSYQLADLPLGTHQFRIDIVLKDVPAIDDFRVWMTRDLMIVNQSDKPQTPEQPEQLQH